jgi:metallo-beta-lactamase class B
VFSPAAWIVRDKLLAFAARPHDPRRDQKIWFVSGGLETNDNALYSVGEDQAKLVATLTAAGFPQGSLHASLPADGRHAEWFWRREFPAAYRWLFAEEGAANPAKP